MSSSKRTTAALIATHGALAVALLAPGAAAAATSCSSAGSKSFYGLKASGTTCRTALAVARNWGKVDEFSSTDQGGRRWRCKFTLSTTPGQTRTQCRLGSRVVGFRLRDTQ